MSIPVPSLEVQREAVAAWQGLRKIKEENEGLVEPLLALCRSYLQECKKKYPMKEIGPMIDEENLRNDNAMRTGKRLIMNAGKSSHLRPHCFSV